MILCCFIEFSVQKAPLCLTIFVLVVSRLVSKEFRFLAYLVLDIVRYTVWVIFLYWREQDRDTIREISCLEEEFSWEVFSPQSDIRNKICLLYHLLKRFRNILVKPYTLRSDCSFRSNLIWVHTVCFYIIKTTTLYCPA